MIQVFLKASERFPDVLSQIGVVDRIVILEFQKLGQFRLIQFLHAYADVVKEHEIKKHLLPAVEVGADLHLGFSSSLAAGWLFGDP